jgi:hypothetical protein
MAIRLAAGNGAKIGIKPNVTGKVYSTGYLYLTEMSAESALEFSNSVATQEVYGTTTAKNVQGIDEATFSCTAFLANHTGMVHRYTVGTPGSGYTSGPTVALTGTATTVATAISEVDLALGTVTAVWPTAFGDGYSSAPSVAFSGGAGTGAAATAVISGDTLYALDEMIRAGIYLKVEFSPQGGTTSSLKTRYTFEITRESFSITPAVNGVIALAISGKAENIVKDTW